MMSLEEEINIAHHVAWRLWQSTINQELEELQSESILCMLKAKKAYKPECGKYKSFLYTRIWQRLIDWMRDNSELSRLEIKKLQAGLREPLRICSIESKFPDSETRIHETLIAKPEKYLKDDVEWVLDRVKKPKYRRILELYYLEDMTMRQVGKKLKISESRISQIHDQLITRLRGLFENDTIATL